MNMQKCLQNIKCQNIFTGKTFQYRKYKTITFQSSKELRNKYALRKIKVWQKDRKLLEFTLMKIFILLELSKMP